jgi:hypothetical protein
MKLTQILTLITAGTGLLALPAHADDHDHDKKHKKHSEEYYHDHHSNVTIGIGAYRPYYGRSSTVIVARDHPAYYGRESYGYDTGYSGRSVGIDVQRGLARRGYYRGPIDGDIGPGSRASIRAFQADNGFAPSGRIDHGLVIALR